MGHVWSKTRTLGQILRKLCVRSTGYIFSLEILKLGHSVCLDKILDEFENGSCRVKKLVTTLNLLKTLYTLERPHFSLDTHETLSECLL